jgi:putative ubiquitin-RnfH superfamily antitoxin RatB of RatAB toxin-antitoxin module
MIEVEVAYARPDVQRLLKLHVPEGTTLVEAVRRSGITQEFPEIDLAGATLGIFGKVVKNHDQVLREKDRVEVYRPLINDPKSQRAQRAESQKKGGE